MTEMSGDDVRAAVAASLAVLEPLTDGDWEVRAGRLEWNCRRTAAHISHDLIAYAGQIAGGVGDAYLPYDLEVRTEATPRHLLDVLRACGSVLASALDAAPPGATGWHWGAADVSGFAALGVDEIVVHTYDITQGLGAHWMPPERLARGVLDRLFPDAPAGDAAEVLLWCTGRIALADRPRRTGEWTLKAAR